MNTYTQYRSLKVALKFSSILFVCVLFSLSAYAQKVKNQKSIFSRENLIAWCIVPFDVKERGPAERAEMLNKLGITMLAYDWREKHVPTFEEEIEQLKKHNIKLQAFWYYSGANPENDRNFATIIEVLKKHHVKTEIWCMVSGIKGLDEMTQEEKIKTVAKPVAYIADKAAEIGCKLGLYNHGGWYGEPENQLQIIDYLKKPNIGIVYNFHHAEEHIATFPQFFPKLVPHLLAINLSGLKKGNPTKVVPIGQGDAELDMIKIVKNSAYNGPIGIINEDTAPDAEVGLMLNMDGLKGILEKLGDEDALKSYK
ncbi:sugar phosphate isomerase/epimerase family protein [Dyadobacter psychrophilus]|uniref:Sugar phosphate isomerase/epimerase n=1 Tax=Dyadobacter psychrophilus TaxID=651661 RepID=A0A1T5H4W4_9BACT|nr:TIM barrel protein [Dyadobacter psychrophilus]SKC15733.1 Sugar phosphate isomerase/epimerase [Dyadobacter psychrophilus]